MTNHILLTLSMYPWDIIGMCVVEHDNSSFAFGVPRKLRQELTTKIMQAMGFYGNDEYVELYPGRYMTNSAIWRVNHHYEKTPDDGVGAYRDDKDIINVHQHLTQRGMYSDVKETAASRFARDNDFYNYMLLLQPTIADMRKVPGFKSSKIGQLWMCSDWKEGR